MFLEYQGDLRRDSAAQTGDEVTGMPNTWNKQHVHGSVIGEGGQRKGCI